KLENMIRRIREVSPRSKLVIISSVPRWHVSAVHAFQTSEKARIGGSKVYARATIWPEVDSALSNIASEYAATFIAPTEQLCLNRTNQCLISLENSDVLIYSDYNHLTKQGSEYLMGVLSERIQSVLHANSQISK
ncbi:MAG: hypothetical protein KDD43_13775, partial [Bdellovibrionales bacterium]|nr:hypothetical protein [Bdellovibrionales bacterium]